MPRTRTSKAVTTKELLDRAHIIEAWFRDEAQTTGDVKELVTRAAEYFEEPQMLCALAPEWDLAVEAVMAADGEVGR